MIVYVAIGNSDDKLSQRDWALFQIDVNQALHTGGALYHGEWTSHPTSMFQNACWCAEINAVDAAPIKKKLRELAKAYRQDSIIWAVAPQSEFLGPQ